MSGQLSIEEVAEAFGADSIRSFQVVGCRDHSTHYVEIIDGQLGPKTLCGRRRAFEIVVTPRNRIKPVSCDECGRRNLEIVFR